MIVWDPQPSAPSATRAARGRSASQSARPTQRGARASSPLCEEMVQNYNTSHTLVKGSQAEKNPGRCCHPKLRLAMLPCLVPWWF